MGFDIVEVAFAMNALLIVTLIRQIHNISSMPYAYALLSDDNHRHGTTLVYATIPFHYLLLPLFCFHLAAKENICRCFHLHPLH